MVLFSLLGIPLAVLALWAWKTERPYEPFLRFVFIVYLLVSLAVKTPYTLRAINFLTLIVLLPVALVRRFGRTPSA